MKPRYKQIDGVMVHRSIVEKILGHELPKNAAIHHRKGWSNKNENLIVCQDQIYHKLIEGREAAYRVTGDPAQRKCIICKQYDKLENMQYRLHIPPRQPQFHHKTCWAKYNRNRRARLRSQNHDG